MKSFPFIFFLIVLVLTSSPKIFAKGLFHSLPRQVCEWQALDEDERFNRNTLFEYINGGAELYLAYDFQQAFVRRYVGPDQAEIILDIYDMGSSEDAFGVFSVERQDEDIGIGQGSEYGGGLLRFWQDRFFVSIMTTGDEKLAKSAMFRLAQDVGRSINIQGNKPTLIEALPREGQKPTSLRFFHTAPILNRQYFLAEKNILNLDKNTNCILAKYQKEERSAYVLLIQYQSGELAKKAYQNFIVSYVPEAKTSGMAQVENKTWVMTKIKKNYLILVLEATRKEYAIDLLAGIKL
jgi:hypothetical protein